MKKEKEDETKHPLFEYDVLDLIHKSIIFESKISWKDNLSVYRYAKSKKTNQNSLSIKISEKHKIIKERQTNALYNEYKIVKQCIHSFIVS